MPDFGLLGSAIGSVGSAVGDLYTQNAYYQAAQGYTQAGNMENQAAGIFDQNALIDKASGGIQLAQARRALYQNESSTMAASGGAGLSGSGSMGDVLRGSGQQGALQQALIGAQTEIKVNSDTTQAIGARAQASAMYSESSQATAMGNASGAKSGFDMLSGVASMAGFAAMAFL